MFCFHSRVYHRRLRFHRSTYWGPRLDDRECPDCGATIEVRL